MKRDYNKITAALPSNWNELKLWQYRKIEQITLKDSDDVDNDFVSQERTLAIISVLTEIPFEELMETPYALIVPMAHKLAFTTILPKYEKNLSTIKWKTIEEVKYDDFVNYLQLSKDPMGNIVPIVKAFSHNKMTEEEINQLSMLEVYSSFFTLKKYVRRFIMTMFMSLAVLLLKQSIREIVKRLMKRKSKDKGAS